MDDVAVQRSICLIPQLGSQEEVTGLAHKLCGASLSIAFLFWAYRFTQRGILRHD